MPYGIYTAVFGVLELVVVVLVFVGVDVTELDDAGLGIDADGFGVEVFGLNMYGYWYVGCVGGSEFGGC